MIKRVKVRGETAFKSGFRYDLNCFFRSAWEANYARYLNFLKKTRVIKGWEYEPHRFEFEGIKRGNNSYLPDFKVTYADGSVEYHEVKGHMTQGGRTKLKRMAKYHPGVNVRLIDADYYREIKRKFSRAIEGWE